MLAALALAACEADVGPTPESGRPDPQPTDRTLEFGVYGSDEELDAYASLVDVYNSLYDGAEMTMTGYGSREELMGEIRETGEVPDVFLTDQRDLAWLQESQSLQPVDSLLIERGVDFGDLYARGAVLAFSADSRLQCMPVGISPMVIFYNTELVDFETMTARGLPAPTEGLNWNFEQFVAAAEFASRPNRSTVGTHVDPTLRGLAPFIYAAGGEVFDDAEAPTSLAFSDDATQSALGTILQVFRDPRLTLSEKQLDRRPAMEWFKRGKLGMIPGFRDQVPMLREAPDLSFDVLPIPGIERNATIGGFTGMCVSGDTGNATAAADFLVHMNSPVSIRRLASSGHLVPANLEVALSDDFVQPGREPLHAQVFTNSVRNIVLPPLLDNWADLEDAVHSSIMTLLIAPVITDLEALTLRIDEQSQTVLSPDEEEPSDEASSEAP
jgi:multiple sugar transport system substrate-binding protein